MALRNSQIHQKTFFSFQNKTNQDFNSEWGGIDLISMAVNIQVPSYLPVPDINSTAPVSKNFCIFLSEADLLVIYPKLYFTAD